MQTEVRLLDGSNRLVGWFFVSSSTTTSFSAIIDKVTDHGSNETRSFAYSPVNDTIYVSMGDFDWLFDHADFEAADTEFYEETVSIDADDVIGMTIVADKLTVSTLSAISTNFGPLIVGALQIPPGTLT